MTALQKWQKQVTACRAAREEPDGKAWQRMASWYENWVEHNDYVEIIMPRLSRLLTPTARVLEIGPGSGAFTIPFAAQVQEVVVIESSATMREILTQNLARANITNVRVVPQRVEDGLPKLKEHFDLAFASFALYNVYQIDAIIRELVHRARHCAFLMGTEDQRTWYLDLYRQLKGRDRVSPPQFCPFYAVLLEMGIYADVEIIWTSANYIYNDEAEMVNSWMKRLHLTEQDREIVQSTLLNLAERRGDNVGIYDQRRAALVQIDCERNVFKI